MLSPIEVELYWRRLLSIVDEAATTLVQASFSSAIRDFLDFACAVTDSRGKMLVQSTQSTPGLMGMLPFLVANVMEAYPPEELEPGDVLITNDPWMGSGHLVDISVVTPVFVDGEIVAYIACAAHALNVGGRLATLESKNMYEEGLKIPVVKIVSAGAPQSAVFDFISANVWEPHKVIGDIRAQMASNAVMSDGVKEFLRGHEISGLNELADEICSRSEQSLRKAITEWPDGEATSEMSLAIPGLEEPVDLRLRLEVAGDEIFLDYTGTSGQVDRAVNVTLNMTRSYSFYILKCLLDPVVPNNAGCLEPVKLIAPLGSVVNTERPSPTWGRTMIAHFLPELVNRALREIVPDQVVAPSGSTPLAYCNLVGTRSDGSSFFSIISFHGGMGASAMGDGLACISFPANCANIPVEIVEAESPFLIRKKELVADSGGAGKFRGGLGQAIEIEVLEGDLGPRGSVLAGVRGGRMGLPVDGVGGGLGSIAAQMQLNGQDIASGSQISLVGGDVLRVVLPGGGGFGDPVERDPDALQVDVEQGYVTATELYSARV